jgi:hypothetical protein
MAPSTPISDRPAEDLYGLLLMQHQPFGEYPIHREIKQTEYQAQVG